MTRIGRHPLCQAGIYLRRPCRAERVVEAMYGDAQQAWTLEGHSERVLIRSERGHPFDATHTVRFLIFDLEVVQAELESILDQLQLRLGARRLILRACPQATDASDLRPLFDLLPMIGRLPHYWSTPIFRLDDVLLDYVPREDELPLSRYAPDEPVSALDAEVDPIWNTIQRYRMDWRHEGRFYTMRPIANSDVPALHALEADPEQVGWTFRGGAPSIEAYASFLASQTDLQYALVRKDGQIAGRILLGDVPQDDFRHGSVGVVLHPREWKRGGVVESLWYFVNECFDVLPLRCVYFRMSSATSAYRAVERRLPLWAHQTAASYRRNNFADALTYGLLREQVGELRENADQITGDFRTAGAPEPNRTGGHSRRTRSVTGRPLRQFR